MNNKQLNNNKLEVAPGTNLGYKKMKKIMAVLTVLMCFASTNAFAQLKEVRGIQTRVVEYQGDKNLDMIHYKRHGFEFKNENNYTVWVEAELCTNGFQYESAIYTVNAGTCGTKSFTLKAGETYVWKCGDKMIYRDYGSKDFYNQYFVKYTAYKTE